MIPDNLHGGLVVCLINLIVVMSVLALLAWGIGLMSRLITHLQHRPNRNHGDSNNAAVGRTMMR